jgi:LysM repeat protein
MRRHLAALVLAVVLPLPGLSAEVVVKPGETLSQIAERHGVSLERLLRANGIADPDHVEVGRRLTIPAGTGSAATAGGGRVTVQAGETLSEIADRHGVSLRRLQEVNGLADADHVEIGQSLVLPGSGGGGSVTAATQRAFTYEKGAREHVVRSGESLSQIADGYGVPLSQLVSLNGIENPNKVNAGRKLRLVATAAAAADDAPPAAPSPKRAETAQPAARVARASAAAPPAAAAPAAPQPEAVATKTASWRSYGPLQVDWANWQPMGGSLVAPTLGATGEAIYLAINCEARKLNATTASGQWKTWDDPSADFEQKLVNDLCTSRER